MRYAFDIGGVLSKYPVVFRAMISALVADGREVFVISDMHDRAEILRQLESNGFIPPIDPGRVYSADYEQYGEACKVHLIRALAIDCLVDDHPGYTVWPFAGPAPVRLRVEPDPYQPYWHPSWDAGAGGDFGRRAYLPPRGESDDD